MVLLVSLLAVDLAFAVLHIVHARAPWIVGWQFSVETDRGFPEMFQYLQIAASEAMLVALWWRTAEVAYAGWTVVYGYLLCDDVLEFHEKGGELIAQLWGLPSVGGLRPMDLGELVVSVGVGVLLLAIVTLSYSKGSEIARARSRRLLALLGSLVFFGVFVDDLHQAMPLWTRMLMGLAEDGGEMVVMSGTCAYVFSLIECPASPPPLLITR